MLLLFVRTRDMVGNMLQSIENTLERRLLHAGFFAQIRRTNSEDFYGKANYRSII